MQSDTLVLPDGMRLRLRPLGAGDREGIAGLFARLSPESRYRRFLSPIRELTSRQLDRLADVDQVDGGAVAAVDPRDGSILGVGRYAGDLSQPGAAHIAVAVADELHGLGVGTVLAWLAVQCARRNGYALMVATTLWENRASRAILRRLGFHECGSDGSVVEYALALT